MSKINKKIVGVLIEHEVVNFTGGSGSPVTTHRFIVQTGEDKFIELFSPTDTPSVFIDPGYNLDFECGQKVEMTLVGYFFGGKLKYKLDPDSIKEVK